MTRTQQATAGSAGSALRRRLRPLWPAASSLTVSRHPFRSPAHGAEYLVLPSLANPILLVPARGVDAAEAIQAFAPGRRGRALAAVLRLGLLTLLPVARLRVSDGVEAPLLEELRRLVPETADVAVRLGRPRPGRAVVVTCLDAAGRMVAVGKLGVGPAAPSIAAEHRNLAFVRQLPLTLVESPTSIGHSVVGDGALLVMTVVAGGPAALDPDDPMLHAAMTELASSNGTTRSELANAPQLSQLRSQLDELPADDTAWISTELGVLLERHATTEVELGLWHGDWVAWNQRRSGMGVALWDWEHLEVGVPLGMDYAHYAAQELRRRDGPEPEQEQRWLSLVRAGLRERWGRSDAQIEATLVLYLLVVNARYAADRLQAPDAPPRQGWTRALVEELNRR